MAFSPAKAMTAATSGCIARDVKLLHWGFLVYQANGLGAGGKKIDTELCIDFMSLSPTWQLIGVQALP